jgi:type IV secretion system protein VirB10
MTTAAMPVDAANEPARDIRPLVGRVANNRAAWIFGGVLLLAAIGLFSILEARRSSVSSPATMATRDASGNLIASPPPLAIPDPGFNPNDYPGAFMATTIPSVPGATVPETLPGVPRTPRVSQQGFIPGPPIVRQPPYVDNSPDAPYDAAAAAAAAAGAAAAEAAEAAAAEGYYDERGRFISNQKLAGNRVGATRLLNPSTTVPQGAVLQAVLETALDSNRPGFVRAIVSRDVRSFDGSKILIPRGSRLFGEYKADLTQGQNRAFIQWQTLTRPDGVQIAVNSPAADPLGRAGVKGNVDSHFFERFAGAILQSTLDIGVGIATRSASEGTVVVGLPGSQQTLINDQNQQNVQPTLKVKHGASVSVFVARDLDFIAVE